MRLRIPMRKLNITNLIKILLISIPAITISACAVKNKSVNITPQLNTLNYNIGNSQKVNIIITDNRKTEILGSSISNIGQQSNLQTDKKLIQNIKNAVTKSMESYGFVPVKKGVPKKLILNIINLSYTQQSKYLVKGSIEINCDIKATVINKYQKFSRIFRTTYKEKTTFNPDSQTDYKNINKVISINLQKILSDKDILNILTTKSH
jgi:uncharacterized lipoprotein YajG